MELIETVSPKLTRRLESLKAEIAQDQSVGATDENKVREFRDLTPTGRGRLSPHALGEYSFSQ